MAHFGHGGASRGDYRGMRRPDDRRDDRDGYNDRGFDGVGPRGRPERDAYARDYRRGDGASMEHRLRPESGRGSDYDSRSESGMYRHGYGRRRSRSRSRTRSRSRSRSRSKSRSKSRSPRRHGGDDRSRCGPESKDPTAPVQQPTWHATPSPSLILRGLTPRVSEAMIFQALASFRPKSIRVMFHKVTGEHRGFAFANFESVDAATAVVNAFASHPLVLDNQPTLMAFAEASRPSPNFQNQGGGDVPGQAHGPPRLDWICDQCASSNFARRSECFKCQTPKSRFAMEMPAHAPGPNRPHHFRGVDRGFDRHHASEHPPGRREYHPEPEVEEAPCNVLAVRMIPLEVDEGELQVFFAQFEGVNDIRLIRDRTTNQSRGFAFVEFVDIESAQRVRDQRETLRIRGEPVRIGFARDSFHKPPVRLPNEPVPLNPIAAAALEQAQWALGNGYGMMHQQGEQQQGQESGQQDFVELEDLDALLDNAAAEARPHIEEPKKPWPLPFETGGGMYVYKSDSGLYYDTDSMFYYDPHSKLYYSSFMGVYYTCKNGALGAAATFEPFAALPPADDAKFTPEMAPPSPTHNTASASKPVALSLASKKKKPLISFSLKPVGGSALPAPTAAGFEAPLVTPQIPVPGPGVLGTGAPVASAASASVRKKNAMDIAKWSHRQRQVADDEAPADVQPVAPGGELPRPRSASIPTTVAPTVDVPLEAPICLLCRRKFASMEQLKKHESLSKLHAENLAKAKADKEAVAAQIRERDQEEFEQNKKIKLAESVTLHQTRVPSAPAPVAAGTDSSTAEDAAEVALQSGVGAKMLKMMGWKKGEGLGKHGTGITAPVQAVGNTGSETTGLGAKTTPAIDLSEVASYKERLQKMARARYDSATEHDRKTL